MNRKPVISREQILGEDKPTVSKAEAQTALQKSGVQLLKLDRLEANATVGRYLATHLHGHILSEATQICTDYLQRVMTALLKDVEDSDEDVVTPDQRVAAANAINGTVKSWCEAQNTAMDAAAVIAHGNKKDRHDAGAGAPVIVGGQTYIDARSIHGSENGHSGSPRD
jgi:hypothetical protein